jgi:hypothetical protein
MLWHLDARVWKNTEVVNARECHSRILPLPAERSGAEARTRPPVRRCRNPFPFTSIRRARPHSQSIKVERLCVESSLVSGKRRSAHQQQRIEREQIGQEVKRQDTVCPGRINSSATILIWRTVNWVRHCSLSYTHALLTSLCSSGVHRVFSTPRVSA